MDTSPRKILPRVLLVIAVIVGLIVVVYTAFATRSTGYSALKESIQSDQQPHRQQLDAVIKRAREAPEADIPAERLPEFPAKSHYERLASSSFYGSPYLVQFHGGESITTEGVVHRARGNLTTIIHWEAFPASFSLPQLDLIRRALDGEAEPNVEDPHSLESGAAELYVHILQYRLSLIGWRYVHESLRGNHPEALSALADWMELAADSPHWVSAEPEIVQSVSGMLNMIGALGSDAPPESFTLMESFLAERMAYFDRENVGPRIDAMFRTESARAAHSSLGDGTFSIFMGGFVAKVQKNALLPLARKEMEFAAVAIANDDKDAFLAALNRYGTLKERFPDRWLSAGFYEWQVEWESYVEVVDGAHIWKTRKRTRQLAMDELGRLREEWASGEKEKDRLRFLLFVNRVLAFRHKEARWPEDADCKALMNDGTADGAMEWMDPDRVFVLFPYNGAIEKARRDWDSENWRTGGKPTLENLPEIVGPEFAEQVRARTFKAERRPLLYKIAGKEEVPAAHIFIPTTFSEEFRRFMRGEDTMPEGSTDTSSPAAHP